MSSVLFNRGILTQTGGRRKADEAERVIESLKKSVTDAALTTAEHTTTIRTLQAQVSDLEEKLLVLYEKMEKSPSDSEEVEAPLAAAAPAPELKISDAKGPDLKNVKGKR